MINSLIDLQSNNLQIHDSKDYTSKVDPYVVQSMSKRTREGYKADMKYFWEWMKLSNPGESVVTEEIVIKHIFHHLEGMPKEIEKQLIAKNVKKDAGVHSFSHVKRRIVALSVFHKLNDLPNPCKSEKVKDLLRAMHKSRTSLKKSKAISKKVLEDIIATCDKGTLIDIRDKAIILFAFCSGGRRRSEIQEASMEDLQKVDNGEYLYRVAKSKTDQKGKGFSVPITGKAAEALKEWLDKSGIKFGRIFRSINKSQALGESYHHMSLTEMFKRRIRQAGYDESIYSLHSLRSGFVTEAGKQGCSLGDTMALTGHKDVVVAMGYFQAGDVFNNKAARLI
jgi:integrase